MLRDRGPIHNIGFGVTSREFSRGEDIQDTPSASSGYISNALEGKPIFKMASALLATGIGATIAGKLVRGQGLKLRKINYRQSLN